MYKVKVYSHSRRRLLGPCLQGPAKEVGTQLHVLGSFSVLGIRLPMQQGSKTNGVQLCPPVVPMRHNCVAVHFLCDGTVSVSLDYVTTERVGVQ